MALTPARTMPGVLELLPLDQIAFQRMLDVIRRNYERFGFLPIETPVIEYSDVLLTKTGGETERQVYFVQSTGALGAGEGGHARAGAALRSHRAAGALCGRARARSELPVPPLPDAARVSRRARAARSLPRVLSVRHRRDRQGCAVGALRRRIPAVIYSVFRELNIGAFTIQLNNRKLMRGYFESLGIVDGEQQMLVLREVDKLDKRGADYVRDTLTGEAFGSVPRWRRKSSPSCRCARRRCRMRSTSSMRLGAGPEAMEQGRAELKEVLGLIHAFGVPETHYALNLSIARGLDYYTGTVYETTLNDHPQIGSICSGGRYENLAGQYTKSHLPGVGISIGLTRLYWQLRDAGLISTAQSTVDVLVTQMDAAQLPAYLALASELRAPASPPKWCWKAASSASSSSTPIAPASAS
jgi:histidyl-tRNA synthetase